MFQGSSLLSKIVDFPISKAVDEARTHHLTRRCVTTPPTLDRMVDAMPPRG